MLTRRKFIVLGLSAGITILATSPKDIALAEGTQFQTNKPKTKKTKKKAAPKNCSKSDRALSAAQKKLAKALKKRKSVVADIKRDRVKLKTHQKQNRKDFGYVNEYNRQIKFLKKRQKKTKISNLADADGRTLHELEVLRDGHASGLSMGKSFVDALEYTIDRGKRRKAKLDREIRDLRSLILKLKAERLKKQCKKK